MATAIVVYFTHVEVQGYHMGDAPLLEKQHTIWDRVYHKAFAKGMIYDANRHTLMLPRGIDIDRLAWMLGNNPPIQVVYNSDPVEKMDRQLNIKYTPRDEKQKEAIKFIMGMGDYKYTLNNSMISLNLNTGVGKTYCAIASMCLMGNRCIIITSSSNCLEQWQLCFKQYTDIRDDEICWLDPTSIRRVQKRGKKYPVYLALHSTIRAYAKAAGWDGVHDLFNFLGVGCKIYDESHLEMDNMFYIDCYTNTKKTLYLTATPNRSDYAEDKIFQEQFNGVPFIDLFDRNEDPHSRYAAYRYNTNLSPYEISRCNGPYGLKRSEYIDIVVEKREFAYMMHILVRQALAKDGKSLWYIGTNHGIDYVYDWLMANYPELTGIVGKFYGVIPANQRREQLDNKIILTNTKSAGAAVDISGLTEVVMLAEPFRSKVLARQTFGRLRADNTIYKDVVDVSMRQLNTYYNAKKPVFNKYATECKDVRIRSDELLRRAREVLLDRRQYYTPFFIANQDGVLEGKYRYPFTPFDISMQLLEEENRQTSR